LAPHNTILTADPLLLIVKKARNGCKSVAFQRTQETGRGGIALQGRIRTDEKPHFLPLRFKRLHQAREKRDFTFDQPSVTKKLSSMFASMLKNLGQGAEKVRMCGLTQILTAESKVPWAGQIPVRSLGNRQSNCNRNRTARSRHLSPRRHFIEIR
jgi:hypothetical protein